jgi:cytochrome c-type biogenesis protein CcmH/NrfG
MNTAKAASLGSPRSTETTWTNSQAYVLAAFCLVLGVMLGYLFRGSASQGLPANTSAASASATQATGGQGQLTPEQQKAMTDQAAAPLLETLKNKPSDFDTIVKLGNLYYDGQQFPAAIEYYERALTIQPDNPDVITDLGTAHWYLKDADRAISEFQKSLKIRPDHAGTLFNLGIVRWQGKNDPAGAVVAWQELLRRNPSYPQRQQVEEIIAKAKQHASKG